MRSPFAAFAVLLSLLTSPLSALDLDVNDDDSIRSAASTVAYGLVKYYSGNVTNTPETIGVLPKPHYWWQSGAMWGLLLDYYHYTGDSTYHSITTQAILSQLGPEYDFMVPMYFLSEGNDDQAFWGFAAMSAAERNDTQPPIGNYTWVRLVENLWNTQARRWDMATCGGGLKWQIFSYNNGYTYKNTVSNAALFQISARLARFTGNQTYVEWAHKAYDWISSSGLLDSGYQLLDGAEDTTNCTKINEIIWTYNNAIFLYGSAVMYNYTNGSSLWAERTQGLLNASENFFSPFQNSVNIMYEPACETVGTCNTDQFSFKGYLSRFMWKTTVLAPFTQNSISALLTASSQAAARSCSGGIDGVTCGTRWYVDGWDGEYGVGQQMSALETIQGLLISKSVPPLRSEDLKVVAISSSSTPSATPIATKTEIASPTASKKSGASSSSIGRDSEHLLFVTGVFFGLKLMLDF